MESKKRDSYSDCDEIDIDDVDDINGVTIDENNSPKAHNKYEEYKVTDSTKPPIYNGKEPYFVFKRRWDSFLVHKEQKEIHDIILMFLNELFDTDHDSLIMIKNLPDKNLPDNETISELFESNDRYQKLNMIYNKNISNYQIIDTILAKINFSFVRAESKDGIYYTVKAHKQYKLY